MASILFLIFCQLVLSYYLVKFKHSFNFFEYRGLQKSHEGFTPRVGGMIIIIFSYAYVFFADQNSILFTYEVLIGTVLIFLFGLKEDLFGNVSPITRFLILIISSFIFIFNSESFPELNINVMEEFYDFKLFKIIFYVLALTALANGTNMIDGMNGLGGFSILSMIISIIVLSYIHDSLELVLTCLLIILATSIFLIFNFPKGFMFMGDTGAYWLGWITGIIILKFFSANPQISLWTVVLITSYPMTEVIFSFIRKYLSGYSPFDADHKHIHIKLFFAMGGSEGDENKKKLYNALVTICLMPLWFIPLTFVTLIDQFPFLLFIALIIQIFIYMAFYFILPDPDKKKYLTIFKKY